MSVALGVSGNDSPAGCAQGGNSPVESLWAYAWSMGASGLRSLLVPARGGVDITHAHNPPDTFVLIGALDKLPGRRSVDGHHGESPEMDAAP